MKTIIIACSFFLITSCGGGGGTEKSTSNASSQATLYSSATVTKNSANLNWGNPFPSDHKTHAAIYLNNTLIHEEDNISTFNITNLIKNTEYTSSITIIDIDTKQSVSNAFSFNTLDNLAPSNFTVQATKIGDTFVDLLWTDAKDPDGVSLNFQIKLNDIITTDNFADTSTTLHNLLPNTSYTVTVQASDIEGKTNIATYTFTTYANGAELSHDSITIKDLSREYALFKPTNPNHLKRPLVIDLHGAGGHVWKETQGNYWIKLAGKENFYLLQPQALTINDPDPVLEWDSFSRLPTTSKYYADFLSHSWIHPWDDVTFINDVMDFVAAQNDIDLDRVYVTGMSAGGFMTYAVIPALQDKIAAAAPLSGLIPNIMFEYYTLHKPLPLCHIHGTADTIVRIDGAGENRPLGGL